MTIKFQKWETHLEVSKMKTAIVGLGMIGKVHIQTLRDMSAEIVAVCDVDTEKLFAYSEICGYTNYFKMLEDVKPDVVHICTPHYLHAEMIIAALERNINVLCEKPLCIRKKDIERIKNIEKKSKAQLAVCHQNRYNDVNVYLKNYLVDKEILSAYGTVVWKRDKEYYSQAAWRGTKDKEGGGVLINQALHTLDLMQWFCGMPSSVVAQTGNFSLKNVIEVEDTASIFCIGKQNFNFFATNAGGCDMDTQIFLKLTNGDEIVVYPQTLFINGNKVCNEEIEKYVGKCCYGNGHGKLFADFYKSIRLNEKFAIDGEESAKVVEIILSAYKSNGRIVKIKI